MIWIIPAAIAAAVMLIFMITFKDSKSTTNANEL